MLSYKGRTVILFMMIGVLAGVLLTWTFTDMFDSASYADAGAGGSGGSAEAGEDTLQTLLQSSGLSKEQIMKIATTFKLIDTKYYTEVDNETVIDGAIEGMLGALGDPYSVYMDAERAEQFNSAVIESTFTGIGAEVTMNQGKVTVIAPIKGSPADLAGIRAKDVILSVNGEQLEGLSLNQAVAKIRGPKGTQAKLHILRDGSQEPVEITVVRDEIDQETVYARMEEGDIGVIEIRQFAMNTAERFLTELERLEEQGIEGLVIDVRNNPGGLMVSAVQMAEPFVPKGNVILQVENREGKVEKETSREGKGKPYPVAVLVNGGSASASEILAAAIREEGNGVIIGETTFGKGLVQSNYDSGAGDGSNVKITIAKWLTPKGNFVNETGIEPDVVVEQPAYFQVMPMSKATTLRPGDLHTDVKQLQMMLEGLGLTPDRQDGYFSEKTAEMVQAFQEAAGMEATGTVDKTTAEAIEQALIEKMMDPQNDLQMNKALEYVKKGKR